MGITQIPAVAAYSSQPPANASSVLLDGQLINSTSYSTSVTGTGASWALYANGVFPTTFTLTGVTGSPFSVSPGSIVYTPAITGSTSVSITTNLAPSNFSSTTLPTSAYWRDVTFGNNTFVTINQSNTTAAYSTNGTTWNSSTLANSNSNNAIAYGAGLFVTLGWSSTTTNYSSNGTTWTAGTSATAGTNYNYGMCFANGKFVSPAASSTSGLTSTNGTTWSTFTLPSTSSWFTICGGGGYFFTADGSSGNTGAYSTNGTTWTAVTLPSSISGWYGSAMNSSGQAIAVTTTPTTTGLYSPDGGKTWGAMTLPALAGINGSYKATWYNGLFLVTSLSNIFYSTNGITWSTVSNSASTGQGSVVMGTISTTQYAMYVDSSSSTNSSYSTFATSPTAFGIYNGPTTTH
jgi:hypothetical protein